MWFLSSGNVKMRYFDASKAWPDGWASTQDFAGVGEWDVERQNRRRFDVGDARGRLGEDHLPVAVDDFVVGLVQQPDPHLVRADLRPLPLQAQDQVQAGVHRRELLNQDVLENAEDGDLAGLVHEGVIGDDREVDVDDASTVL